MDRSLWRSYSESLRKNTPKVIVATSMPEKIFISNGFLKSFTFALSVDFKDLKAFVR